MSEKPPADFKLELRLHVGRVETLTALALRYLGRGAIPEVRLALEALAEANENCRRTLGV